MSTNDDDILMNISLLKTFLKDAAFDDYCDYDLAMLMADGLYMDIKEAIMNKREGCSDDNVISLFDYEK